MISASRMPTRYSQRRNAAANNPATDDLSTPPYPLITARTLLTCPNGLKMSCASLATAEKLARRSSSISATLTSTYNPSATSSTTCCTVSTRDYLMGDSSEGNASVTRTRLSWTLTFGIIPNSTKLRFWISGCLTKANDL